VELEDAADVDPAFGDIYEAGGRNVSGKTGMERIVEG
jgi:hypothetical protein